MKIITVMEAAHTPQNIYSKANTKHSRALVGYMMRSGNIDNTIFGGALSLLRDIEDARRENHIYQLIINTDKIDDIMSIVEMVRDGKFNRFSISKFEVYKNKNIMRRLMK